MFKRLIDRVQPKPGDAPSSPSHAAIDQGNDPALEPVDTANATKEDLAHLLAKRTAQLTRYQSKFTDLVSAFKELTSAKEKLEKMLEVSQDPWRKHYERYLTYDNIIEPAG